MQQNNSVTITPFESDKVLMRSLLRSFGSVIVYVFHSQLNQESQQFLEQFTFSAGVFGTYANVKYFSVQASKCPETFKKFEIEVTPTVLITQTDKKILKRYEIPEDIGLIFDELGTECETYGQNFESQKKIEIPKIENILQSCPVIVFIKGTPENPKCGFSSTILEILKQHSIEYTYYDILEDENMRNWMKIYRDWPTFPQLYVNKKFLGGLDLIKESVAKGQFAKEFPESCKQQTAEAKYTALMVEHESIALVDKFAFQSKETEAFLKESNSKYQNLYICNVALDGKLAAYVKEHVKVHLPFVISQGKVVA